MNKNKIKKDPVSRRGFLKILAFLLTLIPVKLVFDILNRSKDIKKAGSIVLIPMDLPEGVSFHNKVIAINNSSGIRFLTSKCTHLGCKIQDTDQGLLVCPCHGSRFTTTGQVKNGPAQKPLQELAYSADLSNRTYQIQIPS